MSDPKLTNSTIPLFLNNITYTANENGVATPEAWERPEAGAAYLQAAATLKAAVHIGECLTALGCAVMDLTAAVREAGRARPVREMEEERPEGWRRPLC